ncbi:MAG: DUF5069 domain-containing protein [Candidatus Eremiobacteraeota bacterium]|nr:DUF5069 domain-containing protein [Candidatus Eremiobacteraeota bacterium]
MWLPRLIDKTRSALGGKLGTYLYGQSPIDSDFLARLGLGYGRFAEIVEQASDDEEVLYILQEQVPIGVARARAWSKTLAKKRRLILWILDLDDGYLEAWYWKVLRLAANLASGMITRFVKRCWPLNAAPLDLDSRV